MNPAKKKKATKSAAVKFRDLKSKNDPKGGFSWGVAASAGGGAGKDLKVDYFKVI